MLLQFSEFYQKYSSINLGNGEKIFFKPNIPMKKLNNALNAYASHVKAEDVYVLADDTFWGKADNGLLITNSGLFTNNPVLSLLADTKCLSFKNSKFTVNSYSKPSL